MNEKIHPGEVRCVDFLNEYNVFIAYAESTMGDFFDTLRDYIGCLAVITVHPQLSTRIEYVSIALDHFSVLVRVQETDLRKETQFVAFLRELSLKCDVVPLNEEADLSKLQERFQVQFDNQQKDEHDQQKDEHQQQKDEHRRMLPNVSIYETQICITRMGEFLRKNNMVFDRLMRLYYNEIYTHNDSFVDYEFLLWSVWHTSVGYMTVSKFYGLESDFRAKNELKEKDIEKEIEFNGDDLVVLRGIGHGGYGSVNACYHVKYHQVFAVKQPIGKSKSDVDRLYAEYQHMRRFSRHPAIIHAFAWVDSVDGKPGIVEEYAVYGSADVFCDKMVRAQDNSFVVFVYIDCLFALRYMHSMGYVHRDFKLANVLIDSTYHAKLADFGSCCTYEEAHLHLDGNVTYGNWELETDKHREFTFHTDMGMLTRAIFNDRVGITHDVGANPLLHNIPGFSVQSIRSPLANFLQIMRYGFMNISCVHFRLFEYIKLQMEIPERKDINVMTQYVLFLCLKFNPNALSAAPGSHVINESENVNLHIGKAIGRVNEPWFESLDKIWSSLMGLMNHNMRNMSLTLTYIFGNAPWITKKWGWRGCFIRRVMREMFQRSSLKDAKLMEILVAYLTYVFQFCDQDERTENMSLLKRGFKLSKPMNIADVGVCLGMEMIKQHKYREANKILCEAIVIGKRSGHDLDMTERQCWMLETGIWELAKLWLDRSLPTYNPKKIRSMVKIIGTKCLQIFCGDLLSVITNFQQKPELLIWTILLIEIDIVEHCFGLAENGQLCVIVLYLLYTRPLRCKVALLRWMRYLIKLDPEQFDFLQEYASRLYTWLQWDCKLADELENTSWPVLAVEMYPELVWMKQQALKHHLI